MYSNTLTVPRTLARVAFLMASISTPRLVQCALPEHAPGFTVAALLTTFWHVFHAFLPRNGFSRFQKWVPFLFLVAFAAALTGYAYSGHPVARLFCEGVLVGHAMVFAVGPPVRLL